MKKNRNKNHRTFHKFVDIQEPCSSPFKESQPVSKMRVDHKKAAKGTVARNTYTREYETIDITQKAFVHCCHNELFLPVELILHRSFLTMIFIMLCTLSSSMSTFATSGSTNPSSHSQSLRVLATFIIHQVWSFRTMWSMIQFLAALQQFRALFRLVCALACSETVKALIESCYYYAQRSSTAMST